MFSRATLIAYRCDKLGIILGKKPHVFLEVCPHDHFSITKYPLNRHNPTRGEEKWNPRLADLTFSLFDGGGQRWPCDIIKILNPTESNEFSWKLNQDKMVFTHHHHHHHLE